MSENRRKTGTALIHAIRFAVFFVLFAILFFTAQYYLNYDRTSYTRVMMHELHEPEKNIDYLFTGSSHAYRQYIPDILDEYLDGYCFNAGSSSQHLDGSYAMMVEAGKKNDLKAVFVELCPAHKGLTFKDRTSMTETYILSDYMYEGWNKIRFLLNASSDTYYVNSFFPLLRNKEKYLEPGYVKKAVSLKSDESYNAYVYPSTNRKTYSEWYAGRGYVANDFVIENGNLAVDMNVGPFPEDLFSEDELKTLDDMVSYCRKNEIRLIFVASPLTDFYVSSHGNYDTGREAIVRYCTENNVEFYDFNLCRPEYFTYELERFMDKSHLNHNGAQIFSRMVGEFFSGKIDEKDLFYDSYEEKVEAMHRKTTFGMRYKIEKTDEKKIVHLLPILSDEFTVKADVYTVNEKGEETRILTKDVLPEDIELDAEETGTLHIDVYDGDDPETYSNLFTISY